MSLNERHPALAAVDSVALLAWDETTSSTLMNVSARRIDLTTGDPIDPMPLVLSGAMGLKSNPSVASVTSSTGASFFITWTDGTSGINAARLALDGGTVGSGIVVTPVMGSAESDARFDGKRVVVAWQMPDGGVAGRRIDASTGAAGPIETMSARGGKPSLAFEGTGICAIQLFDASDSAMRVHLLTLDPTNDDGGSITVGMADGGSVASDAGSSTDGGSGGSDAGATVLCEANPSATVGLPYIFNAGERIVVTNPPVGALDFIDCSQNRVAGFHVDGQTGSVAWVPLTAGTYLLCVGVRQLPSSSWCPFNVTVVSHDTGSGPAANITLPAEGVDVGATLQPTGNSGLDAADVAFFRWDFGDMTPLAFGAKPSHVYGLAGGYQISLTVFDAYGRSSTTKSSIRVRNGAPITTPPVVVLQANPLVGSGTQLVSFDSIVASGDGTVETYSWDFGDGKTGTGSSVTHTFQPGRYRVRLRVTDSNALVAVDSVMVEVDDPLLGAPPSCRAWVSPAAQQLPDDLAFTFFAEDDYDLTTDGGIVSEVLTVDMDPPPAAFVPQMKKLSTAGTARSELVVQNAAQLFCHDNAEAVLLPLKMDGPALIGDGLPPPGSCGTNYSFTPLVGGAPPITLTATEVPDGGVFDPTTGTLRWAVPASTQGMFDFTLVARNDAGSATRDFSIDIDCAQRAVPLDFHTDACGCTSVGPSALALVALALLRRRRRA